MITHVPSSDQHESCLLHLSYQLVDSGRFVETKNKHQAPGSSVAKQPRNLDAKMYPFERAREYTRALNATKMERMFAAPFIAQLGNGHVDGVYARPRTQSPSSILPVVAATD